MLKNAKVFSSFSVKDITAAEKFYSETLQLNVVKQPEGISLKLSEGQDVFIYPKENHEPASFTVLNFIVDDLEKTVDELSAQGVKFEHFDFGFTSTDEKGIMRGDRGPKLIAWFKDPEGNFLSVLQHS